MTKLLMKIWGWMKREEESIGKKPVDVKPEEQELVVPPPSIKEVEGEYRKYWKCKCGWYLQTINEWHGITYSNRSAPSNSSSVIINGGPTAQQIFETNECCPKCGKDKADVKVMKGREIRRVGMIYSIRLVYVSSCGQNKNAVACDGVNEFLRMDWLEEFKLVKEDLRPELLC